MKPYSAFHCLYDLAPLRPGLRVVRDGLLHGSDELSALLQFARAALEGATSLERELVALTLDECGSEEGSALVHNVRELPWPLASHLARERFSTLVHFHNTCRRWRRRRQSIC